ncbi:MAG: hypothetical protein JXR29_03845, partial [Methylothermaceae bacterium]|nr:hypothetical protein [Methylothermaceae bacterium]
NFVLYQSSSRTFYPTILPLPPRVLSGSQARNTAAIGVIADFGGPLFLVLSIPGNPGSATIRFQMLY